MRVSYFGRPNSSFNPACSEKISNSCEGLRHVIEFLFCFTCLTKAINTCIPAVSSEVIFSAARVTFAFLLAHFVSFENVFDNDDITISPTSVMLLVDAACSS